MFGVGWKGALWNGEVRDGKPDLCFSTKDVCANSIVSESSEDSFSTTPQLFSSAAFVDVLSSLHPQRFEGVAVLGSKCESKQKVRKWNGTARVFAAERGGDVSVEALPWRSVFPTTLNPRRLSRRVS